MLPRLHYVAFAAACAAAAVSGQASARSLHAEYSISVLGLPVGSLRLDAELDGDAYSIDFFGQAKGLAKLFADTEATARAAGQARPDGSFQPARYEQFWAEGDDTEAIAVRFAGDAAAEVTVDPPPRRPERYVPVTAAHKTNVMDPASAFIWPAPEGLVPGACDRTLPVFDGRRRFDLVFRADGSETVKGRAGSYSGPASVCTIRYRPISGHRPKRDSVRYMAENEDMRVWMAPAGDGLLVPVKIRVRAEIGPIVIEARRFSLDHPPDRADAMR